MAQGTPPSAHAAAFQGGLNRLHRLFKIIFRHELFIVLIEPQVLHQLLNVSKGDVPMTLLPDATTAASERSSLKNRPTGSRRRGSGIKRGSGINRHRSKKTS